jgi:3-oxoacyl-[acyl-carrier protein] reductase
MGTPDPGHHRIMDEPWIIAGGSGGIGAALAARHPDRAVVWSRRTGVDVTDPTSVRNALDEVERARGVPFALVHTVGDFDERPLLGSDLAFYREMVESNLTSTFVLAREVVPRMRDAGRGRVVFFAVAGVDHGTAHVRSPIYYAAKAAVTSLARSLALEVAPSGVTVNVVAPGVIRHPTSHAQSQVRVEKEVPLGRGGTPGDVLGVVELLLSDAGSYITGDVLTVDGGLALRGPDA